MSADRRLANVEINLGGRESSNFDNFGKDFEESDVTFRQIGQHFGLPLKNIFTRVRSATFVAPCIV